MKGKHKGGNAYSPVGVSDDDFEEYTQTLVQKLEWGGTHDVIKCMRPEDLVSLKRMLNGMGTGELIESTMDIVEGIRELTIPQYMEVLNFIDNSEVEGVSK